MLGLLAFFVLVVVAGNVLTLTRLLPDADLEIPVVVDDFDHFVVHSAKILGSIAVGNGFRQTEGEPDRSFRFRNGTPLRPGISNKCHLIVVILGVSRGDFHFDTFDFDIDGDIGVGGILYRYTDLQPFTLCGIKINGHPGGERGGNIAGGQQFVHRL